MSDKRGRKVFVPRLMWVLPVLSFAERSRALCACERAPRSRFEQMLHPTHPSRRLTYSAVWLAKAMMVKEGSTLTELGKELPSTMNRFLISWDSPWESVTHRRGSSPRRQVARRCGPPLIPRSEE